MNSISYIAAAFAFFLACLVAIKDRRSFANRTFIAFLALLALTEVLVNSSRQEIQVFSFALLPGAGLLFSLSFARMDYRRYLARWKYIILLAFGLPSAVLFLPAPLFERPAEVISPVIPLRYPGKIFYALILIIAVLIMANIEHTLRGSTGRIRWQIKFVVLGMSVICASWIYSASQAIIYSALDTSLALVRSTALLGACVLFFWGLKRSQFRNVDVYLSRATLQYSLTAMLAGIYLVILGLLAYAVRFLNPNRRLPLDALLVLIALGGLGILLLSDRLNEQIKRLVIRHFKRPIHDYRKAWMELTEKTNPLVGIHDLCTVVAKVISKTFNILSVNVWLCDEDKPRLSLAGSTVFARYQAEELERCGESVSELLHAVKDRTAPIDLENEMFDWGADVMRAKPEYFADFKMRYILPLQSGGQLVGVITLNSDRVGKAPLSIEDRDLLNAYAAQLAARVLQLRLSENLRKAQEIEAFQNVSAFFIHDLKNIASRLSLTMQNLPAYFDNPDFRADALKLIGKSAAKINVTISRLSSLKQVDINPVRGDLNSLVQASLKDFECSTRFELQKSFGELPELSMDPEQIQKVVTNLVTNAYDAVKGEGTIRVVTSIRDHKAILSIEDNGCGMSRQFIEKMLFRPFSSTKKQGMGIGLFHSKMIVEAHNGRIEVDSEEGKGSTFRVVLPISEPELKRQTPRAQKAAEEAESCLCASPRS